MAVRRHRANYLIAILPVILMAISLVLIYAVSPRVVQSEGGHDNYAYFKKHAFAVGLSLAALVFGFVVPRRWYTLVAERHPKFGFLADFARKIIWPAFAICFLVPVIGRLGGGGIVVCANGACRWLKLGGLSIQVAEILKLAVIFYVPWLIKDRRERGLMHTANYWVPLATVVFLTAVTVGWLQNDLGSTAVILLMVGAMVFISGVSLREIGIIAGVTVCAIICLLFTSGHRIARIKSWLCSLRNEDVSVCAAEKSDDYHIENAKISFGVGGWMGVGIGNSVSSTGYLPESVSDSIFPVLGETMGLAGTYGIILAYMVTSLSMMKTAQRSENEEDALLTLGVFAWIFGHVIINVSGMLGLVPMKGITLPFLSYGGTSMLFVAFAVGVVLQISGWTKRENIDEDFDSRGRQRRTRVAGDRSRS